MTARLEWKLGNLWLGKVEVARTEWMAGHAHRYRIAGRDWSASYQTANNAAAALATLKGRR